MNRKTDTFSRSARVTGALALVAALLLLPACHRTTPAAEPAAPVETPSPVEAPAATEIPATPERTVSGAMLLGGEETTVYLALSDTEITLWDSPTAGNLLAVAKFAQPMSGAAEALQGCDFSDLDADGNSELTANFAFADGGFVYNEEFSVLPGETPAGGGE